MIASWMLYAALVGVLLTLASIGLDRVAVARRRPVRMIWFSALLLSVALPIGRAAARFAPEPTAPARVIPFTITVQSPAITTRASMWNWENVDRALLIAWVALSAVLLLRLTRSVLTLRRSRGAWESTDVDGTAVRLSRNVGPAVIGLRSMDVVVPEWILSLDAPLRAIVLRHEEEHRTARDPYLLFAAAIAVALMPWNLALWFQARRLRLAIELDCDARVLRAHPSTERYGMLMLTIAQRRSVGPTLFSPMLTEPTTLLERRILAMRPTTRLARVTVYGGIALAVAALAFACSLQSDTTGPKAAPLAVTENQTFREFQVEQPAALLPGSVAPIYPEQLKTAGVQGKLLTRFVVDTTGLPLMETFKVIERTDERFIPAVREAIPKLRFSPAGVGGKKVKQLVEMPFEFMLSKDGPEGGRGSVEFNVRKVQELKGLAVVESRNSNEPKRMLPKGVYFDYQVESPALPLPSNSPPRYPSELRAANVEGQVMAHFIVNEDGAVDSATFTVVRAEQPEFVQAVRAALPSFRFSPALVGGRPVKQLVQMPFKFALSK